jgi:hypothetical protein
MNKYVIDISAWFVVEADDEDMAFTVATDHGCMLDLDGFEIVNVELETDDNE